MRITKPPPLRDTGGPYEKCGGKDRYTGHDRVYWKVGLRAVGSGLYILKVFTIVTLYTWLPPSPEQLHRERLLPDFGHSALLVQSDGSGRTTYVSFWPECESLIGVATRPWKQRATRHPRTYAEESDRTEGFMQRPADFADVLHGLDEERIHKGWEEFKERPYVLETFNCSNVTHILLALAMPPHLYALVREEGDALPEDPGILDHVTAIHIRLRKLLVHRFTSEQPLQVRLIALTYERLAGYRHPEDSRSLSPESQVAAEDAFTERSATT